MRKYFFFLLVFLFSLPAWATTYYVDSSVSSSGNGLSWNTAWKGVTNITGVAAGDIVYFSGGSTSQIYPIGAPWAAAGGTLGNPITYAVGQDAGHNGTVIFDGGGTVSPWVNPANYTTINGGVGGTIHIQTQNFALVQELVVAPTSHGITLLYIAFQASDAINLNFSDHFEVGFCTMHALNDHAITVSGPPPAIGYGVNKFHHNTVILDQNPNGSGNGADGFQWSNSVDIFTNIFLGNATSAYTGTQHQDGIQTDGQYTRAWDNTFVNLGNTNGFFLNFFSNDSDIQIWNNISYFTDTRYVGGFQKAVSVAAFTPCSSGSPCLMQRLLVLNNTTANFSDNTTVIALSNGGGEGVYDSSDVVQNNIVYCDNAYPCGGYQFGSNVTNSNNAFLTSGGSTDFVAWQLPTSTPFAYDFNLKSTASAIRGQGLNLTSLGIGPTGQELNRDFNGMLRPTSGSWDLGAIQFGVSPPVPPTVTTTSATGITTTSFNSGGNVINGGNATVTARGVCVGLLPNPNTNCTSDGTGTGIFTSFIGSRVPGTTYHYNAYATNSAGTGYGSDLTVTTPTSMFTGLSIGKGVKLGTNLASH